MVICTYFLQGRCRFGQSCRFEHSYNNYQDDRQGRNQNVSSNQANNIAWQIAKEVLAAEKGNMWPLTCFAPFKEGPCFPGWEDFSPEEVRWNLYEAQKNGSVDQCLNQINQLHRNAERARNSLKQPTPEIISLINDILAGKKPSAPLNTSNVFPNSPLQAKTNPFEAKTSEFRFDVAPNSNIFGGNSSPPPSYPDQNIFQSTNNTSQNIFTTPQQQSNQNIFSNTNQNIFSTPSQNIFSTPQSPQQSGTNQNIFSTPQNAQPSGTNQNIFSNTQPPNQNLFTQNNTGNIFSSNNSNNSFSSTNPVFAQNESQNYGNVFGGAQSNFQQQQQRNPGFGQDQSAFGNYQQTSGAFGNQHEVSQGVGFNQVQSDACFYSNMEDLTDEEMKSFSSPTFAFGKIPLKPPPQQYC